MRLESGTFSFGVITATQVTTGLEAAMPGAVYVYAFPYTLKGDGLRKAVIVVANSLLSQSAARVQLVGSQVPVLSAPPNFVNIGGLLPLPYDDRSALIIPPDVYFPYFGLLVGTGSSMSGTVGASAFFERWVNEESKVAPAGREVNRGR